MWDSTTCLDFQVSRRFFFSQTQLPCSDFASNKDLRVFREHNELFKTLSFFIKPAHLVVKYFKDGKWRQQIIQTVLPGVKEIYFTQVSLKEILLSKFFAINQDKVTKEPF